MVSCSSVSRCRLLRLPLTRTRSTTYASASQPSCAEAAGTASMDTVVDGSPQIRCDTADSERPVTRFPSTDTILSPQFMRPHSAAGPPSNNSFTTKDVVCPPASEAHGSDGGANGRPGLILYLTTREETSSRRIRPALVGPFQPPRCVVCLAHHTDPVVPTCCGSDVTDWGPQFRPKKKQPPCIGQNRKKRREEMCVLGPCAFVLGVCAVV